MHEEQVRVKSGDVELAGTLCAPEKNGRFPAVLMVHGSGPLDRNENVKGQPLNIFNAMAHALADCGIASLRYDKRGCGDSSGDYMRAGHSDLVQDALCCLDFLEEFEQVSANDLYILGHSEGCVIAPQMALQRPAVSGLVLLCPFIENIESVLHRQAVQLQKEIDAMRGIRGAFYRVLVKLIGSPVASQARLLAKVRESDLPVVRSGLTRFPARWLRELLALDTESIFASTNTPMILIGGEKDLQCNPGDIFRIEEIAPSPTETLMFEGMTHLLRVDEAAASLLGSRRLLKRDVEKTLTEKTAQWILSVSTANRERHATGNAGV